MDWGEIRKYISFMISKVCRRSAVVPFEYFAVVKLRNDMGGNKWIHSFEDIRIPQRPNSLRSI
jgi:hypothetical protein